ncbi:phosphoglycerate kinase [Cardinium endosymbiont of Culicoides punctatus]|uniref:phosphoglycerate kinase n=1 Tax=Cardinium endosymbiont of Culicoides punctatus TaxID=2304601 RepID=UPI0010591A41|nr:phosphoglycerate kinase [Cardinium endosymbiont of Culicoides punctatus]TDG94364.1 Bifunctional PGK/TIM [Cardinium endosymbiont of Culicoides punctatus]
MMLDQACFKNKKVLIRVDFNLPITESGIVTDDRRMRSSLQTIQKVIADGGIAILIAHFGRPKNGYEERYSLRRLLPTLSNLLANPIVFVPSCVGSEVKNLIDSLEPGTVALLENVRFHKEETLGDIAFAQELASLADTYINEAFGTIHRNHASISLLPAYFKERFAGYLLQEEIAAMNKLFLKENQPVIAIMGGSKLVDKAKPIKGLVNYAEHILIGGGLVWPFYHAQQTTSGRLSVCAQEEVAFIANDVCNHINKNMHCQLSLPIDVVHAPEIHEQAHPCISSLENLPYGSHILDIGPATQAHFTSFILQAKTILWSGPMGIFEWDKFSTGTAMIARAVAQATANGAFSIIGGGDTAAAITTMGYEENVSYISTGGGALLAYIAADRKLPSLEALQV